METNLLEASPLAKVMTICKMNSVICKFIHQSLKGSKVKQINTVWLRKSQHKNYLQKHSDNHQPIGLGDGVLEISIDVIIKHQVHLPEETQVKSTRVSHS